MVGGVADRIKRRVRIQKLLELGYSIGAICDEEQCSRMTVLRWKKRLQEGEGEQDRPRRGRPRKLTPALKRQVIDREEGSVMFQIATPPRGSSAKACPSQEKQFVTP